MKQTHTVRVMTQTHDADTDAYLTAAEVCAILKINSRTLIRWDRAGRTAPLRLPNGYRRYRTSDVDALLTGSAS